MNNTEKKYTIEQFKEFLDIHNLKSEISAATDYEGNAYKYLTLQFPVARNTEVITIYEDDDLDAIVSCNFTKYRGITNYEAIWSKDLKCIEAEIQNNRFDRA